MRSNITEFTFHNSPSNVACQQRLLADLQKVVDPFVTLTQGAHEMTVLVHSDLEGLVEKAFARERLVERLPRLAAVAVHLTPKVVGMPGVYYAILKQLMWGNINVVELVSTYTELVIVLNKKDVDRAFAILKGFFWP